MSRHRGMTLIEVLIAVFILFTISTAALVIFPPLFEGRNVSAQMIRAFEAAQKELETIKQMPFATLTDSQHAYDPGLGETPRINTFVPEGVAEQSTGFYYVEKMHDKLGATLDDLVKVDVVVCFRSSERVVGEDSNLSFSIDQGEDLNGNGKVDSVVTLSTLILEHD